MSDEIQLISDGDGLAVIGDAAAVEQFLTSERLPSKDLGISNLRNAAQAGAGALETGSKIAEASGRWVQLTKETAETLKKYDLRKSGATNLETGVIKRSNGQVKGFVEFARSPVKSLTSPAALSGAAGLMAQLAMQQTMDQIIDYLATIDEKVDDVLRAQKDQVLAQVVGVGLVIDETVTIRNARGRVDEVLWSRVQGTPTIIAHTMSYALRQIDAQVEKLENKAGVSELAAELEKARPVVREWLAVLARCIQLNDAVSILELDRVLDLSPTEIDAHRIGLRDARAKRLDLITGQTSRLYERTKSAIALANSKVLLNPFDSPAVVRRSTEVASAVSDFHGTLGIEQEQITTEARQWSAAAGEIRDRSLSTGAEGIETVARLSAETFDGAKGVANKLAGRLSRKTRNAAKDTPND